MKYVNKIAIAVLAVCMMTPNKSLPAFDFCSVFNTTIDKVSNAAHSIWDNKGKIAGITTGIAAAATGSYFYRKNILNGFKALGNHIGSHKKAYGIGATTLALGTLAVYGTYKIIKLLTNTTNENENKNENNENTNENEKDYDI